MLWQLTSNCSQVIPGRSYVSILPLFVLFSQRSSSTEDWHHHQGAVCFGDEEQRAWDRCDQSGIWMMLDKCPFFITVHQISLILYEWWRKMCDTEMYWHDCIVWCFVYFGFIVFFPYCFAAAQWSQEDDGQAQGMHSGQLLRQCWNDETPRGIFPSLKTSVSCSETLSMVDEQ